MIDFRFFPVFNIADIAVCVGAGFLILYTLFFSEDDASKRLRAVRENRRENKTSEKGPPGSGGRSAWIKIQKYTFVIDEETQSTALDCSAFFAAWE